MAHRFVVDSVHPNQVRLPPIEVKSSNRYRTPAHFRLTEMVPMVPSLPRINDAGILKEKTNETTRKHLNKASGGCGRDSKTADKFSTQLPRWSKRRNFAQIDRENWSEEENNGVCTKYGFHGLKGKPSDLGTGKTKVALFGNPVMKIRRRLNGSKIYQCGEQPTQQELLSIDQNMQKMSTFKGRCKTIEIKDLNGKKVESSKVFEEDITSVIALFEAHERELKTSANCEGEAKSLEQASNQIRDRFVEALDLHVYHYYRNIQPNRRMAICEEIERKTFVDNVALSCCREYLRLQSLLDLWVL